MSMSGLNYTLTLTRTFLKKKFDISQLKIHFCESLVLTQGKFKLFFKKFLDSKDFFL
jgi:hypothetical protein